MSYKKGDYVSVVVPVLNEKGNIKRLITSLNKALSAKAPFEIIFIDDYSTDGTFEYLKDLKEDYIKVFRKKGVRGKAFSLMEGLALARGNTLVLLDGDLQYPAAKIPRMIEKLSSSDVVVAQRRKNNESFKRKLLSKNFRYIFGKLFFRLDYDIQSGLKVFKREVYEAAKFEPSSGWTFDLEFLYRAREAGFKIAGHNIEFAKRKRGKTKVLPLATSLEIGTNAFLLKLRGIKPTIVPPNSSSSMLGAGLVYKGKKFVTHTTLPLKDTALATLVPWQKVFIAFILITLFGALLFNTLATLIAITALLSILYFIDTAFHLTAILRSLASDGEIKVGKDEIKSLSGLKLPTYTILCPLYKEAKIIPVFLESIAKLDWPKDKLEVLLLLEEDDVTSIKTTQSMSLPFYVKVLIVPDSLPKTKPKACNYGLANARGEYIVIYDAEDRPESDQLKKAYLAFGKSSEKIGCLQAKLNYYNPDQNILTKFFTAEYSLWFDLTLAGLQSFNTALPLGGTSNHFKTKDLIALQGWDPFNVTEDADLGVRLFKRGFKTAIIDSTTYEEANSKVKNWLRQRSRWLKGYMQTFLVHNRNPISFLKQHKLHALIFQLEFGGKIMFSLINPFLWIVTASYFIFRPIVGETIEALYPAPVFYLASSSLFFGNFLFMYYYMLGCAKRQQWGLIKYVFFVPFYWTLISVGGAVAFFQLILKPHYWEKTIHGYHLRLQDIQDALARFAQEFNSYILTPGVPQAVRRTPEITQIIPESVQEEQKQIPEKSTTLNIRTKGILVILVTGLLNGATLYTSDWDINTIFDPIMISMVLVFAYLFIALLHSINILKPFKTTIYFLSILSFFYAMRASSLEMQEHLFASQLDTSIVASLILFALTTIGKDQLASAARNTTDFFSLFKGIPLYTEGALKILIFNWRDISHTASGGAEIYLHELAKNWVASGNSVTVFCANDGRSKANETIDGVNIIRRGGATSVYFMAFIYYIVLLRDRFDVIVDSENGVPFFTPLYNAKERILLIFHVHQKVFRKYLSFPSSWVALFLEKSLMPFIYRGTPVLTISESSKRDITRLGFDEKNITIVYSGINHSLYKTMKKTSYPSLLYLGRIKEYKNIDIALNAFASVLKSTPQAKFVIAGKGDTTKLKNLAQQLGIQESVIFEGFVSDERKVELMATAWTVIQPSIIEGWGITVIEANACGTPVIASRVNGLCDSVLHKKTGLLFNPQDTGALSRAMREMINDEELRSHLSKQALMWSKNFDWRRSSNIFYYHLLSLKKKTAFDWNKGLAFDKTYGISV